jgi:UDP-N-acetylmuramate dehydrogenase
LKIQEWVPLDDKNWFRTGGPARFFCEPSTAQEMYDAWAWAREHTQNIFVLGQGANILVSDAGFDGLVIRPYLQEIAVTDTDGSAVQVTAGAGTSMDTLIEWCLAHQILGLEEFSGIPGTVGGSVYINLHYYQFLLAHFVHSAQVFEVESGVVSQVTNDWFQFGYNQSTLQQKKHILLHATFTLKKAGELDIAYARGRRVEIIRHRTARYPVKNTCGSFFRNFYENEVTLMSNGKKMIYVAYYLDKVGVKGALQVGGAVVSYQHANMVVNTGSATSTDIIELARAMQQKVYDAFGVLPQAECQLVGFKNNPLL